MADPAAGMDEEIERERLERVEDLSDEDGSDWEQEYVPGTFGCHELLDRTMIAFNMVEEMILSHPACVRDPAWYGLAYRAFKALELLYERVGEVHSGTEDDDFDEVVDESGEEREAEEG